jgi:hypothetical protein
LVWEEGKFDGHCVRPSRHLWSFTAQARCVNLITSPCYLFVFTTTPVCRLTCLPLVRSVLSRAGGGFIKAPSGSACHHPKRSGARVWRPAAINCFFCGYGLHGHWWWRLSPWGFLFIGHVAGHMPQGGCIQAQGGCIQATRSSVGGVARKMLPGRRLEFANQSHYGPLFSMCLWFVSARGLSHAWAMQVRPIPLQFGRQSRVL